jgi:hypothetical protein
MSNKTVAIGDFMTDDMIAQCKRIVVQNWESGEAKWAELIAKEVIEPNITEINRKLGQENDAKYLAYVIVYAMRAVDSAGPS